MSLADMNRREKCCYFIENGAEIANVYAELNDAVSKAGRALAQLGCGIPSFTAERFHSAVMDTIAGHLEEEVREDLCL